MSVPSVVVFDLGKVLIDFDFGISAEKIARRGRATPAQVRQLIDHSPLLRQFESGALSNEEFYREVSSACGYDAGFDDFCEVFADIFSEFKPMTALQAALRNHHVPTYIFSNTNEIAISHVRRKFPFFANFDGYVLSYQHGSIKPEEKIYSVVEKMVGHTGNEILFLDDRAENVEAARSRSWQALLHKTPETTIARVRELGLPVG